jgi:citrate lyase subunit beta/citryl-CoA lyase
MHGARLRSVLYVPGANGRALEKARELPADALIFDLEDAVAPEAKRWARDCACEAARSDAYADRTIAIRINGLGTPWHDDDLIAVAGAAPDAVVVPKVGSAQDIETIEHALQSCSAAAPLRLWAMLETPAAVLRSAEIAAAGERLSVLVMGTNDLLAELRAQEVPDRRPLELSLMMCLLAARAAGRTILDGVYNDVGDAAGLEAECAAGRRLGFDGKTLIHPGQIETCNRMFSASPAELEHARRVIAAFELAAESASGVATLDGRLIEHLHVQSARRTLDMQHTSGVEDAGAQPECRQHASDVKPG